MQLWEAAASMLPFVGTALDLLTLLSSDSTAEERSRARAGLAMSLLTFGTSLSSSIRVASRLGGRADDCVGYAARGGAQSAANAARLNRQLASREIAGGHAFGKHADEFADLGITTRDQFAGHIENIMNNPSAFRELRNGRSAFWTMRRGPL
jgi:hypothetical protein